VTSHNTLPLQLTQIMHTLPCNECKTTINQHTTTNNINRTHNQIHNRTHNQTHNGITIRRSTDSQWTHNRFTMDSQWTHNQTHNRIHNGLTTDPQRTHNRFTKDSQRTHTGFTPKSLKKHWFKKIVRKQSLFFTMVY